MKLGVTLLTCHAGFEKGIAFYPARAPIFQLVAGRIERLLHRGRHPEGKGVANESAVEFFGRDTNDRVPDAIQDLGSANDVRIAVVTILPCPVTNHRDRMRVATFSFLRPKATTNDRPHPESIEIIRGN